MYVVDKNDHRHFITTWQRRDNVVVLAASHVHIDVTLESSTLASSLMLQLDHHSATTSAPFRLPRPESQVIS